LKLLFFSSISILAFFCCLIEGESDGVEQPSDGDSFAAFPMDEPSLNGSDVRRIEIATIVKDAGNKAFKDKDYNAAIRKYSKVNNFC
jgi:hypothetical protein